MKRWLRGVAEIENVAAAQLRESLRPYEQGVARYARQQIDAAMATSDPLLTIALNLPGISREVESRFTENGNANSVMAETATAAYLFGTREGRKRVSAAVQTKAPAIPADEVARRRRTERDKARAYAAAWQDENGRAAARAVSRGVITDVSTGIRTTGIGLAAAMSYRSIYAARNVTVGTARDGMFSSFGFAGMAGWEWQTEEDACEWCWAQAGQTFEAGEEFESHPNCRCSAVPLRELSDGGYDADSLFAELPQQTQISVLGQQKFDLWQQGGFTIRDLAKPRGGVRTIKELKALQPA
jgi:hypothetical protein